MEEKSLSFDHNGYLIPYDLLPVEWDVFYQTFGYNGHRRELLSAYERFLHSLRSLLPVNHKQWIDGSFVTKKSKPGDIDVIIFVPNTHFASIADGLKAIKKVDDKSIDCYFVETFPPNHPNYEIGRADELTWYHFLRTDRRKRLKGSLELWFYYGN